MRQRCAQFVSSCAAGKAARRSTGCADQQQRLLASSRKRTASFLSITGRRRWSVHEGKAHRLAMHPPSRKAHAQAMRQALTSLPFPAAHARRAVWPLPPSSPGRLRRMGRSAPLLPFSLGETGAALPLPVHDPCRKYAGQTARPNRAYRGGAPRAAFACPRRSRAFSGAARRRGTATRQGCFTATPPSRRYSMMISPLSVPPSPTPSPCGSVEAVPSSTGWA